MKTIKHLLIYEVLALMLVFIIYFEFSFIVSSSESDYTAAAVPESTRPIIQSEISLEGSLLFVNETIKLDMPANEVWLNIPANLFSSVKFSQINAAGADVKMQNDNLAMHITSAEPLDTIEIKYELNLPQKRKILSYHEDIVLLTEFLITPAPFVSGRPVLAQRCSFGDPFVYPLLDYDVKISVDSAYQAFAPGGVYQVEGSSNNVFRFKTESQRDFPLVLAKDPAVTKGKIRDIEVTYIGMPDIHAEVEKAFDYIESITCQYPYDEFFVVCAPIDLNGMEFSQMIFISDNIVKAGGKRALNRLIYHEVFHQWFYGIVGTDQINEPFMDEGIVTYLTRVFSGEKVNTNFNIDIFNKDLGSYKSIRDYQNGAYNIGASYFAYLHKKHGDNFYSGLRSIFHKYYGKILTYQDLQSEFGS